MRLYGWNIPYTWPPLKLLQYHFLYLKCYIVSFYIDITLKQNKIATSSQFVLKNLEWFLSLSIQKWKTPFCLHLHLGLDFSKIISCIAFGSASNACCLLKSIAIILERPFSTAKSFKLIYYNFYRCIMLLLVKCSSAHLRTWFPTCTDAHLKRFCVHVISCTKIYNLWRPV